MQMKNGFPSLAYLNQVRVWGRAVLGVHKVLKTCIVEKEIQHTRAGFAELKQLIDNLPADYDGIFTSFSNCSSHC